jgi:hypothetical protein
MKIFSANLRGSTTASYLNVTEDLRTEAINITSTTGSFTIQASGSSDPYFFLVKNQDQEIFSVLTSGVITSITQSSTPTAVQAGIYFDNIGNFYVGL